MTSPKKLIEVALPLEAINIASAQEKSIRHGHSSPTGMWVDMIDPRLTARKTRYITTTANPPGLCASQNWWVFVFGPEMEYSKPPRDYAEQADLLRSRGLIADRCLLVERLKSVNYYRLSGYLNTFRQMDADGRRLDSYHPGTHFTSVWRRYTFDRQLRLLTLDGIERIEIALKTMISHDNSMKYGHFGYLEAINLPRLHSQRHQDFLNRVLGVKPKIPFIARYPEWHSPVSTGANRIFSFLTIIKYFLGYIAPQSKWPDRLKGLLEEYSEIPLNFMGFPENWQNHAIWKNENGQQRSD